MESPIKIDENITENTARDIMRRAGLLAEGDLIRTSNLADNFVATLQSAYWFYFLREGAEYKPSGQTRWLVALTQDQEADLFRGDGSRAEHFEPMRDAMIAWARTEHRVQMSDATYAGLREGVMQTLQQRKEAYEALPGILVGGGPGSEDRGHGLLVACGYAVADAGLATQQQADNLMLLLTRYPSVAIGIMASITQTLGDATPRIIQLNPDDVEIGGSLVLIMRHDCPGCERCQAEAEGAEED